jgi:hypothetical protein
LGTYHEDFEASDGGNFTPSGTTSWTHGTTTKYWYNPQIPSSNVWATSLTSNYGNYENGYLTSPSIALTDLVAEPSIRLSWTQYFAGEPGYDFGSVEVSRNGVEGPWEVRHGPFSTVNSNGAPAAVILDKAYAVPDFRFRFHFTSDDSNTNWGWLIDNVTIQGTSRPACDPMEDTPPPIGPDPQSLWKDKSAVPAVMVADPNAPSGGWVHKVDRAASGGDYFSPATTVTPGQTYCVAADIKWVGGGTPFVGILRSNASNVEWLMGSAYTDAYGPTAVVDPAKTGWQHLTHEIVMPAGTAQVQLVNELYDGAPKAGNNLAYFDGVSITAGGCASAVWVDKEGIPVVMVADPNAPSGGPVQRVDRNASGGDYFSPAITVTAGQTYCVAADIKWVGGGTPFIGILRSNASNVEWLMGSAYTDAYGPTTVVDPISTGWQHLTHQIVMPAETTQVQLVNELFGDVSKAGASLAYFDGVSIGTGACP